MRIALLWANKSLGDYANKPFSDLYAGVGHNTGNLAFVHAIEKHLIGDVTFMPWHSSPDKLKQTADLIVIPCANQLGSHTDLGNLAKNLQQADLPVVAIGLGAQSKSQDEDIALTEGTLEWVKTISSLAISDQPNIYVRGSYTQAQLEKLGIKNSVIGGCPSHFINESEHLGEKIAAHWTKLPERICVAAGHQAWGYTAHLEQQLASLISDSFCPGAYVTQSMQDMLKISRGLFDEIEDKILHRINQYIAPHLNRQEFKRWCRTYARSFYDTPSWMDFLTLYDLAIGHRYHGVALALQAERMGITITIDSRTAELCAETGVPHIHHSDIQQPLTRKNLYEKFVQFDAANYDQFRREKARNYVTFLEANRLQPPEYLYKIASRESIELPVEPASQENYALSLAG